MSPDLKTAPGARVPVAAQITGAALDSPAQLLPPLIRRPWRDFPAWIPELARPGPGMSSAALSQLLDPDMLSKNRHIESCRPKIRPLGSPLTLDRRPEWVIGAGRLERGTRRE